MQTDKTFSLIGRLYSNTFRCPKCMAEVKIPTEAPGQRELFPPSCYSCGSEMVEVR